MVLALYLSAVALASTSALDDEKAKVTAAADALIAAVLSQDVENVAKTLTPEGTVSVATIRLDQTRALRQLSFAEWLKAIPGGPKGRHEARGAASVTIDGDVASFRAPYVVTFNGQPEFCGENHFLLVRGDSWRVASAAWTRRVKGCSAKP
jgi:hypothetical protein